VRFAFPAVLRRRQVAKSPAFYLQIWGAGAELHSKLLCRQSEPPPKLALNVKSATWEREGFAICIHTPGIHMAEPPAWINVERHSGMVVHYIEQFEAYAEACFVFDVPPGCDQIEFTTLATSSNDRQDYAIDLVDALADADEFCFSPMAPSVIAHMANPRGLSWQRTRRYHIPDQSHLTPAQDPDVHAPYDLTASLI